MLRSILLTVLVALAALSLTAQEKDAPGYRLEDTPVVHESLAEVMSRPEFSRLRVEPPEPEEASQTSEWLKRFLNWLARTRGDADKESLSEPIRWPGIELILYAMAGLVLVAAISFILKSIVSSRRERKLDSKHEEARLFRAGEVPGETDPQHYWQRAQALGEQKQFKKAIRELLLGAMSTLERRGLVRHRQGLTNRDYLRAARGVVRESLLTIVSTFEHVYFGRREATADGFHICCREYKKSFLGGSQ
jgi:hypothetical protein